MANLKRKIGVFLYPAFQVYNKVKSGFLRYPTSRGVYISIPAEIMRTYNKTRFHGAKKLFCYNPFLNLFFDTFGNAVACCRSHQNVLGSYPKQTIKEIWFSEKAKKMREHMLNNDLNMGCDYCKLQIESSRFQGLPSMHTEIFATSKSDIFPKIMEFELSNTCNLQCVMCTGRVSSAIRKNRENKEPLPFPYNDAFVEQLKEFIPHLKQAYFFGGEPFLIPIYYKIWEEIININPKVKIYAVTNGTVMNERIENILKNTDFNLTISIDSLVKARAENIRVGCDFEEVIKNISRFKTFSHNNISISHTPMTINWFETPDIINFCNSIDSIINLSYVEGPAEFALWSMMPEKLDEVYKFYKNVKWEGDHKSFKAKYNIKVFNEWKNQVLYFKNRNEKILESFTDIHSDWIKETEKVNAFFNKLQNITEIDYNKITQLSEIFNELLCNIEQTPWHLKTLKNITGSLILKETINIDQFKDFFNNPEKIKTLFDNSGQADFFKTYY